MADLIRGMNNVPLDEEGVAQAIHLGTRLRAKGPITRVISSPLQRAQTTAKIVVEHNPGSRFSYSTPGLEPWHLGEFEGAESNLVCKQLEDFVKNPSRVVPGHGPSSNVPGESFNTFIRRFYSFLDTMLDLVRDDERPLLLGHYRNLKAAKACKDLEGFKVDAEKMVEWPDDLDTAHVFAVRKWGDGLSLRAVDLDCNDPLPWGVVLLGRHGKTSLNG